MTFDQKPEQLLRSCLPDQTAPQGGPVAADFLDEKRREMTSRMKELAPLVSEYRRLEEAVAALDAISAPAKRPAARKATSRAPAPGGGTRKRGRPKGSGTRRAEA